VRFPVHDVVPVCHVQGACAPQLVESVNVVHAVGVPMHVVPPSGYEQPRSAAQPVGSPSQSLQG
jgi:hypothetical protein